MVRKKLSVHTNKKLPLLNVTFSCTRPRNNKTCSFVCETDICNNISTQNSTTKPTVTVSFATWKMDFLIHGIFSDCTSYALHYRKQLCCKNIVTLHFTAILCNSAKGKENAFSVDHQDSTALQENKYSRPMQHSKISPLQSWVLFRHSEQGMICCNRYRCHLLLGKKSFMTF